MRKRTTIKEKTFYTIEQGGLGTVKDANIGNALVTSEDINDINWYLENVLHAKSEGVYNLDQYSAQESDFFMRLGKDKYFVIKSTLKFGHGYHSKTVPDKIKENWAKIHEYYETLKEKTK